MAHAFWVKDQEYQPHVTNEKILYHEQVLTMRSLYEEHDSCLLQHNENTSERTRGGLAGEQVKLTYLFL